MTLQIDLSDLRAILASFTPVEMLSAAVLLMAATIILLVWRLKK